jgi:hypothetical protein
MSIKDSAFAAWRGAVSANVLQRQADDSTPKSENAEVIMMIKLVTFRSALRLNG